MHIKMFLLVEWVLFLLNALFLAFLKLLKIKGIVKSLMCGGHENINEWLWISVADDLYELSKDDDNTINLINIQIMNLQIILIY